MLKIVENDSIVRMNEYCEGDPFGCRILAAYRTYGLGNAFAQFWLQTDIKGNITAVIGSLDNGLTVCAKGGYDSEEIDAFVHMLAGENGALRPVREGECADGLVMRLDRSALAPVAGDVELNPPGEELYSVLENCPGLGFDVPPFEAFYNDIKLRVRMGTAITALRRDGVMPISCAAIHVAGKAALVTMCATVPEFRGKSCGASCVKALLGRLPADEEVYVMCLPGYCAYYERMGFRVAAGFVY